MTLDELQGDLQFLAMNIKDPSHSFSRWFVAWVLPRGPNVQLDGSWKATPVETVTEMLNGAFDLFMLYMSFTCMSLHIELLSL